MEYDNPAARLLAILEAGKLISVNERCGTAWSQLLDAAEGSGLLISRIGKLMDLPEQVISAMKERNFQKKSNYWAHWSYQVNLAFSSQNLQSGWNTFISCIDDNTINGLGLTSELLKLQGNTNLIPKESLESFKKELEDILESVIVSDQPTEVKNYLVRQIRRLIVSIDEYRLTGALPILEHIEAAAGHTLFDPQYKNFIKEDSLGKRFVEVLSVISNVVTVATGLPSISSNISSFTALLGSVGGAI